VNIYRTIGLLALMVLLSSCTFYAPVTYLAYTDAGCAYVVEGWQFNGYQGSSAVDDYRLWRDTPTIERSTQNDHSACKPYHELLNQEIIRRFGNDGSKLLQYEQLEAMSDLQEIYEQLRYTGPLEPTAILSPQHKQHQ
jgi:hypothetical protein